MVVNVTRSANQATVNFQHHWVMADRTRMLMAPYHFSDYLKPCSWFFDVDYFGVAVMALWVPTEEVTFVHDMVSVAKKYMLSTVPASWCDIE